MIENLELMYELKDIETYLGIVKLIVIAICTYYSNFKIINRKIQFDSNMIFSTIIIFIVAICDGIIRYEINYLISIIFLVIAISIVSSKNDIGNSILITIFSLSINYIIYLIAIIFNFIINVGIKVNDDYVNLILIIFCYVLLVKLFFKYKKFKYGFSFLKNNMRNENMDIMMLNISSIILFTVIIISNYSEALSRSLLMGYFIFAIIMFITIQKSLQLYYKQKMLVKELEETKDELANKTKEIEELEAENISISKRSHTLSHKQKSLECKIEEMLSKAEISKEEAAEVKERLETIKEEFYKEKVTTELDKTEILEIDDMLKYMQAECIKNKIDFELQIKGNIHHMTNNLISKEDLETLLADHIKNAIIAINHTDNVNRSILVRLGKIDETYSFYIYDSGIEFEKETLENLGKIPITTHADEGGTGMGFMNTFDTLRKCKASLIIEEYNEPSKDNYTKAIIIKFDGKNEFKINSYRKNEVNKL